jgi:hypothetical protein
LSDAVDHRFERFDDRLGRVESDIKELITLLGFTFLILRYAPK